MLKFYIQSFTQGTLKTLQNTCRTQNDADVLLYQVRHQHTVTCAFVPLDQNLRGDTQHQIEHYSENKVCSWKPQIEYMSMGGCVRARLAREDRVTPVGSLLNGDLSRCQKPHRRSSVIEVGASPRGEGVPFYQSNSSARMNLNCFHSALKKY